MFSLLYPTVLFSSLRKRLCWFSARAAFWSAPAIKVCSYDYGTFASVSSAEGVSSDKGTGVFAVSAAEAALAVLVLALASRSLICPGNVDADYELLTTSELLAKNYSKALEGATLSLRAGALAVMAAAMVVALGRLVTARHPAAAIFSFLALVLTLVMVLFSLSAEYMAALHLIIYPGAILIFFVFATLTTEQRWFSPEAESAQRRSPEERVAVAAAALLSGILLAVLLLTTAIPALSLGLASVQAGPLMRNTALVFGHVVAGPVALGTAIFMRYRFALTLLGALLLLALLVALRLLSPALRRSRRGSGAFSLRRRAALFGGEIRGLHNGRAALPLAVLTAGGAGAETISFSLSCSSSADALLALALTLLAVGFGALVHRSYSFLHFFLVIEAVGLALNLLFTAAAVTTSTPEGEVWVTFGAAIAAAETAVGLALFLALVLSAPRRTTAVTTAGARARVSFRAR